MRDDRAYGVRDEVVLTERGKPIAVMKPLQDGKKEATIARLEAERFLLAAYVEDTSTRLLRGMDRVISSMPFPA